MSEQEFELYLSLLGRLLRLDAAQREQIADELRDHFEERLEELMLLGHSRPAAIQLALEEFGDAAGLAAHFTHISHRRKRRLIMRCTLGTIIGMAAAILLVASLWPDAAPVPVNRTAVAQQAKPADARQAEPRRPVATVDARRAAVEEKLNTRLKEVNFVDQNMGDVFAYLADQVGVDILVNKSFFEESGYSLEQPITLKIEHTDVAARTVLELCLEHFDAADVGYTIRDGLIYITRKYDADEIRVYNCRDLMGVAAGAAMGGDGAMPGGPAGGLGGLGLGGGMPGGMGMEGGYGGMGSGMDISNRPVSGLARVIMTTIHPDTWALSGGTGSIEEFNGLLIVKHSQSVHREIKELLEQIRLAAKGSSGS
jgi:hypothetical protein